MQDKNIKLNKKIALLEIQKALGPYEHDVEIAGRLTPVLASLDKLINERVDNDKEKPLTWSIGNEDDELINTHLRTKLDAILQTEPQVDEPLASFNTIYAAQITLARYFPLNNYSQSEQCSECPICLSELDYENDKANIVFTSQGYNFHRGEREQFPHLYQNPVDRVAFLPRDIKQFEKSSPGPVLRGYLFDTNNLRNRAYVFYNKMIRPLSIFAAVMAGMGGNPFVAVGFVVAGMIVLPALIVAIGFLCDLGRFIKAKYTPVVLNPKIDELQANINHHYKQALKNQPSSAAAVNKELEIKLENVNYNLPAPGASASESKPDTPDNPGNLNPSTPLLPTSLNSAVDRRPSL